MSFTVPDLAAATYPAQAGLDSVDLTVLAAGSALTGVVSGCAPTAQGTPNMTVAVAAGIARIGGRRVTVAGGNVTIAAADGTNPRFDLVTVDTSGALAAVTGTPAATTTGSEAVDPAVPAGRAVLAAVYVPAAATSVTAGQITDKRVTVADPPIENVLWYGATGDGVTDDTAAINAALAVAAARGVLTPYLQTAAGTPLFKGGGGVYFPVGTYLHTGLVLGNRVTLIGDGWGSILKLKSGANAHAITNAAHAIMCGVRDLRVDGNALGQAATTIAAGSNGAAPTAATINVASTANFPASGSILVATVDAGPQTVTYTGKTGTTFTGCTATGVGNGNGTLGTGGYVKPLIHGIYWNFATTPDPTLDEDFDGNFYCDHTLVVNATADAYCTNGRGSTHLTDVKAYMSGRNGFRLDQDVLGTNLDTGWSGSHGIVIVGSGGGINGAKAWYCGRTAGSSTWLGWVSGFAVYYTNNTVLNGCSAQDNSQSGLYAEGPSGLQVSSFTADSNGAGGANGAGITLWQTTRTMVAGSSVDNTRNPNRQPYALSLGGGNVGCRVTVMAAGNTGGNIDPGTAAAELAGNYVAFNDARAAIQSENYTIYTSGGVTYAINGTTGGLDYSAADPGAVLTSVIGVLGTAGGTVTFKAGAYTWGSTPALPPNLTGWLKLIAEPGVTINLSTAAPRFLDFGRTAAGQTFNYLHVEGFTINAAALAAVGSGHHMVLGTWTGSSTITGQDVNFDHITIRRVRTLNVRTAGDATAQHFNVWIALHVTNNATQYKLTNIVVEECEFHGGNYGVGIYGARQTGFTGADADIWEDNIVVRDIWHDTGITPTGFGSFAHVHLGSAAKGGTCWVERINGRNSWDVGIEIDNFETAYVNDCRLENYNGLAIAITNFVTVPNLAAQTYFLTNITGYWTSATGAWSSDASGLVGIVQSNNGAGVPQTFGRVIARNLKMFRSGSSLDTNGVEGDLVLLKNSMIEFLLDGAQYQATGLTHTTGAPSPTVIFTLPAAPRTRVTLRNIDIHLAGTFGVGSSALGVTPLFLSGVLDLLVDNVSVDSQLTNIAAFSTHGIDVGTAGAGLSDIRGTIRGFRFSTNDGGARGIIVDAAANLTISPRLLVEGGNFTGIPSGAAEILYLDATNKAKTWTQDVVWRVFPPAAYTLAAPTSGTATRYTETWAGLLSITGGTVSIVEVSRDGTTFVRVASGTNVAVPMQHTDYYRITYTVAPTLTVLPRI